LSDFVQGGTQIERGFKRAFRHVEKTLRSVYDETGTPVILYESIIYRLVPGGKRSGRSFC
jgi:hypothetical protein